MSNGSGSGVVRLARGGACEFTERVHGEHEVCVGDEVSIGPSGTLVISIVGRDHRDGRWSGPIVFVDGSVRGDARTKVGRWVGLTPETYEDGVYRRPRASGGERGKL